MIAFIYGVVGALLVLGLLTGGFFLGWRAKGIAIEKAKKEVEQQYSEKELKTMRDNMQAFDQMLAYSVDQAYGINTEPNVEDL